METYNIIIINNKFNNFKEIHKKYQNKNKIKKFMLLN